MALAVGLFAGCPNDRRAKQPTFEIAALGLTLPKLSGWVVDPEIGADNVSTGGVVFRLVRDSPVPLAPRVDVWVEAQRAQPTLLENFLTQNLREMAQHENDAQVRIVNVEQRPATVGPRRAFRVQHEYTMSTGGGVAPIAITQVSTLFILDGRGVAVTALGRTELFHPLADQIERIMAGLDLPVPRDMPVPDAKPNQATPGPRPDPRLPAEIQPIDLGKIGGN